jgi:hypothetical protein
MAFGSSGMPPNSTYKIAPASNRLQKNIYGGGYHEVMDYGAIDALPNPGYGATTGMQDDDILVQKMTDLMQNQFGLKPKMQGPSYTAFRVRYFPLSLTGSAFQWFTSLPPQSVGTWTELEQKFHAHYFSGRTEKKLIDLTTLK